MSVCRRIILIFLIVLLFESVVGEIHRAKPTWSKNVGSGSNHHHIHSQHHRSAHKYSSGSNNVAPRSTVSSSSSNIDGGSKEEDEDYFGSDRSSWISQQSTSQKDEDRDHLVDDGDDRTMLGDGDDVGASASLFSDIDKHHSDDDRGTGGGGSIADRIRQQQQPTDIYTWLFTLISASFVGFTGVLPLILIPLESGKSLRQGAGYNQLKLFLSFAVGGLLGDVFLHLLPEAWNHVHTCEDFMWIGKWVLTGILSFLVIEKVMGDESSENTEDSEDVTENSTEKDEMESSMLDYQIKNTNSVDSTHGNVSLSKENKLKKDKSSKGQKQPKKESIKITGYLNLFANGVDNFTHGLAIAGSYLVSRKVGVITTIAILLHEIPHEVGDFAILLRAGFDRWEAAKAQLLTATVGLLGAITALTAESAEEAGVKTAWILPFTAGSFIYIALVSIVPELVNEDKPRQSLNQMLCICAGIACMLLVTQVFE